MKKILIAVAALTLLCAPAGAQGFLDKLKEKAGQALEGAAGLTERISEAAQGVIPDNIKQMAGQEDAPEGLGVVSGEQALPPRRASSFGWDGPVTPSAAKFPIPLMNEFPAVPSPEELANPTEEKQIAYYKAIKAVTLRAEELNSDTTCEDQETLMWRKKSNKMLREMFGLTDAEIKMLDDENLPEAERQRLEEKIAKAMLGDLNVDDLEKQAAQYEGKSEAELVDMVGNKTIAATDAVFDRNAAGLRKYCGVGPEEFKKASRAQMQSSQPDKVCPEMEALNKKVKAYQKAEAAKDPNFQKEADAFEKKMQRETMEATKAASGMGGMLGAIGSITQKAAPIMELEQKMAKYVSDIQKLTLVADTGADAQFSAADRKKLLALKEKIYSTDDPSVYNPLYLQALELIRTYRLRAAKVWAADVQKRFNTMKENMSSLIKINRQAVADELIPECALWRMPLNLVISAGDVLAEAYSEFPSQYPPMYDEEVIRELKLDGVPGFNASKEGSVVPWWPEFSVFGPALFDEVASGKYIFASNGDGEVYQFSAGKWTLLDRKRVKELNDMKTTATPKSQTWTSQDGKRKVLFNAEGGFILLPEGDQVYADTFKLNGNKIQWVKMDSGEVDGVFKYRLVLCTYKL